MAVLVEAYSVLIRRDSIATAFEGGWEALLASVPNNTLCFDDHLARIGFMAPADAGHFMDRLAVGGLVYVNAEEQPQDFVVADQLTGISMDCWWIEMFHADHFGSGTKVMAARFAGDQSWDIAVPKGWNYEQSLSRKTLFMTPKEEKTRLILLRHEKGQDVYLDLNTGKEVYVGRTSRE